VAYSAPVQSTQVSATRGRGHRWTSGCSGGRGTRFFNGEQTYEFYNFQLLLAGESHPADLKIQLDVNSKPE
jgi:hypothetical protein